jgi:hypothetical protein
MAADAAADPQARESKDERVGFRWLRQICKEECLKVPLIPVPFCYSVQGIAESQDMRFQLCETMVFFS